MSRKDPQINIRLPQVLKERIHEVAMLNGRSVNAEVVYRLESSFLQDIQEDELLTPDEALAISRLARENLFSVLFNACTSAINTAAKSGAHSAYLDVYKIVGEGYMDDDSNIVKEVVNPVMTALKNAGYTVDIDGHDFCISFNQKDN